ncbi:MAG TPA: hypothetical protein IAC28_04545 [Candidatus Aphodovivens excrementavium]|nr:hypothetical protein [Candidatus Aphodovivens excrementavium]
MRQEKSRANRLRFEYLYIVKATSAYQVEGKTSISKMSSSNCQRIGALGNLGGQFAIQTKGVEVECKQLNWGNANTTGENERKNAPQEIFLKKVAKNA